jgi:hypothetical protein
MPRTTTKLKIVNLNNEINKSLEPRLDKGDGWLFTGHDSNYSSNSMLPASTWQCSDSKQNKFSE